VAYVALKQYQNAIADFNKAIELNPKDPLLFENRAKAFSAFGSAPGVNRQGVQQ
jgi:hypothetical protein